MLPWKTGREVLYKYHTFRFVHQFYNEVLGYAYVPEDANIPRSTVEACSNPNIVNTYSRIASLRDVAVGVDWGDVSWVVVMARGVPGDPGKPHVVYIERIDKESLKLHGLGEDGFSHAKRVAQIMDRFKGAILVNDANGIGADRNSYLIRRYKGRAWGCFYDTAEIQRQKRKTKTIEPQWQRHQGRVTVSRTGTLKLMLAMFRESEIVYPRIDPLITQFVNHVCALGVEQREDALTGAVFEVVGRVGPDHFAHALNYAKIGYDHISGKEHGGGTPGVIGRSRGPRKR
jgi:hypothetical protein